jgi:alpha-tubulin suppressor-like RCC1 family protein
VTAGYGHTCALLRDGSTKCWGDDSFGQLGLADGNASGYGGASKTQMGDKLAALSFGHDVNGAPLTATSLSAGDYHNCAVLNDGSVKCWGYDAYGQLGLGDVNNRGLAAGSMGDALPAVALGTGRTALAVDAGGYHSCALLDNGTVKCWGYDAYGALGQGDTASRGVAAGQMGDNLPAIPLGDGLTARAIAGGYTHTCALLGNHQVKCWGYNAYGQLGLGDTNNRGVAPYQMGNYLPFVSLGAGRSAVALAAGNFHTCALLDNGQVKCWGWGAVGALGQGDTNNRGSAPNQMGDNLPPVALGAGRSAIAITAGGYSTCAVLDDRQIKCWGYDAYGQLGLGDTNNRGVAAGQMGDALAPLDFAWGDQPSLAGGYFHACAIDKNRYVRCWGYNGSGQLGLGDTNNRGDSAGEMGAALTDVNLGLNLTSRR